MKTDCELLELINREGEVMIFTIKVNYKSGISHTFDVTEFKVDGRTYTWKHVDDNNKPIKFGANDVESVWQIGTKEG